MGDRFRDIRGKGSVCCGLGVISVGMRGRVLEGLRLVYLEGGVRGQALMSLGYSAGAAHSDLVVVEGEGIVAFRVVVGVKGGAVRWIVYHLINPRPNLKITF